MTLVRNEKRNGLGESPWYDPRVGSFVVRRQAGQDLGDWWNPLTWFAPAPVPVVNATVQSVDMERNTAEIAAIIRRMEAVLREARTLQNATTGETMTAANFSNYRGPEMENNYVKLRSLGADMVTLGRAWWYVDQVQQWIRYYRGAGARPATTTTPPAVISDADYSQPPPEKRSWLDKTMDAVTKPVDVFGLFNAPAWALAGTAGAGAFLLWPKGKKKPRRKRSKS